MKAEELAIRKKIISLHNKKESTRDIAYLLDISKSKAAYWVKRYKGTGCLEDLPRSGRPTPLMKKKLMCLKDNLKSLVLEQEHKAGFSSKEVLQLIEHKVDKRYTLRHVQRLLHKMGLSLITPRQKHIRKDEKAQDEFRKEFKKNLRKTMWVIPS